MTTETCVLWNLMDFIVSRSRTPTASYIMWCVHHNSITAQVQSHQSSHQMRPRVGAKQGSNANCSRS